MGSPLGELVARGSAMVLGPTDTGGRCGAWTGLQVQLGSAMAPKQPYTNLNPNQSLVSRMWTDTINAMGKPWGNLTPLNRSTHRYFGHGISTHRYFGHRDLNPPVSREWGAQPTNISGMGSQPTDISGMGKFTPPKTVHTP